jgi:hypothetical protein
VTFGVLIAFPLIVELIIFFTIVDDYSRAVWVYLMVEKKEIADLLIQFCKMVAT